MERLRRVVVGIRDTLSRMDSAFLQMVRKHSNLLTAVVTLGIWLWAIGTHQVWMVVGIILARAVSYSVGFVSALAASAVLLVLGDLGPILTTQLVVCQAAGYLCVSWLGYRHKREKILEQERFSRTHHADQVVPWAVLNDVRTSLAAIRFLLFPIDDEKKTKELQKATLELSRLEDLFQEMENKDTRR